MALEQDQDRKVNAVALGSVFRDVRGVLYDLNAQNQDELDITRILHGSKAVTGKAVWSANSARQTDTTERNDAKEKADAEKRALEQLRMAVWDAELTTVGGVQMSNAEAQEARQAIIKDGDRYAKWAIENGYLDAGEEDEFKDAARRMYELKELERTNGRMTEAQQREWDVLQASRAGHAVDATAANIHTEWAAKPRAEAPEKDRGREIFPNAPTVNSAFVAAASGAPVAPTTEPASTQSPAPQQSQSAVPAF